MNKDAVSIVKHGENEKSATKTTNKHSKIDVFDFRCSFSSLFTPKALKNNSITESHREGLRSEKGRCFYCKTR